MSLVDTVYCFCGKNKFLNRLGKKDFYQLHLHIIVEQMEQLFVMMLQIGKALQILQIGWILFHSK